MLFLFDKVEFNVIECCFNKYNFIEIYLCCSAEIIPNLISAIVFSHICWGISIDINTTTNAM